MIHKPRLDVSYTIGIAVLPFIQNPKPGGSAGGLRIIRAYLLKDTYTINHEAPAGMKTVVKTT